VTNLDAGSRATPALNSPAGLKAAQIIGDLARSSAAPADLSTQEEQARATFQSDTGMFMLNWPYVLAAAREGVEEGSLDSAVVEDIGWARYPRVDAGRPSAPPLGGANLAIARTAATPPRPPRSWNARPRWRKSPNT
jgi:multiple sugar transport system substrate-binding protein